MLQTLRIQNLAIIRDLTIDFDGGLTVVSGETGAGKSILIQAIGALLGASLHADAVRSGCRIASVEGIFTPAENISSIPEVQTLDLDVPPDEPMVLRREIQRSGRNRFTINDQVVKKADFQIIGNTLLDVNSQHSHQVLLKSRNHLRLYDASLPDTTALQAVRRAYDQWQGVNTAYRVFAAEVEAMQRRRQLLEYQAADIDGAALKSGEKAALVEERERLRFAEEVKRNLDDACGILDEIPESLTAQAATVAHRIEKASSRDSRMAALRDQAESLLIMARDIADEAQQFRQNVEISPDRLNEVAERIHELQELERKFQNDIRGILEYRETIRAELDGFQNRRAELDALRERWLAVRAVYIEKNLELSRYRRAARRHVAKALADALAGLGMQQARFDVSFNDEWHGDDPCPGEIPEICEETGTDRIEFLLSANPGVPLKPLAAIASGGELSRIMLALKQHFDAIRTSGTLVFDEVDTGIGGDVANAVGRHLQRLAQHTQIICVTHLPQIAVRGDRHILVEKHTAKNATAVSMKELGGSERVREIARMLSGHADDASALAHAADLLDTAMQ